jgi:acyl-CoA reductase-like NAD-dependent aldehyde dehydrogenase
MIITIEEVTIADIDEALKNYREKLQDRYGNRLTYNQRQSYLTKVDDLLDARLKITEGIHGLHRTI